MRANSGLNFKVDDRALSFDVCCSLVLMPRASQQDHELDKMKDLKLGGKLSR